MFNRLIQILLMVTLLTTSAWAQSSPAKIPASTEKVRLQLKWFNQFQFAGYYAAIEKGYYAQEGLDVEIKERVLEKNFVKQVVAGESEYGIGDSGLLTQYAQGEPIAALAAIFQHNPLVFFSRQDSGIISPYEMAGKRVMSDIVSTNEAPLRAMLSGTGILDKDYTLVPQGNNYNELVEQKIDVISGYLTDQPFFFKEKGLKINIINPQNYGIDFYGDILFTSQAELQKHPGRAERFRSASLKGWRYALDHPEEIIQIIHKKYHSKLSVEHLRFEAAETRKLILPDVIPLGQIESSRMKTVGDTYANAGFNRPLTEPELAAFIYTSKASELNLSESEKLWLATHPVIRVGIDNDFAPYEWVDKDGQYVGMAATYMRLLEKKLGVRFEIIKDKSWADILNMAQREELDMLAFAVETPERRQYLIFSEPFKASRAVIIDNGQGNFIGSLDHLAGKRVAIEKGYFLQELLQKNHPKIQLILVANTSDALNLLADGKADAYVGDAGSTNYTIKKEGLLSLRFSGQTDYSSQHSVAVTKNNLELHSIINKALASIPKETTDAIYNRWLGLAVEQGIKPESLIKYGVALVLLLSLFAYWAYRMQREISIRKAAEMREQSRSHIMEMLSTDTPLPPVLEAIVKSVEQLNPEMLCSILLLDQEGKHLLSGAAPSLPDFYNAAIHGIEIGDGVGSCGTAAATRRSVIVDNIESHPYWAPYKSLAAKAGVAACWSQPILSSTGQVLGTFAIYHRQSNTPTKADVATIEQAALLASLAIERKQAALERSESLLLLKTIIEAVPIRIFWKDKNLRYQGCNSIFARDAGLNSPEDLIGKDDFQMGWSAQAELYRADDIAVMASGIAKLFYEESQTTPSGQKIWLSTSKVPLKNKNNESFGVLGTYEDITKRKSNEEKLVASESQARAVMESSPVPMALNDDLGNITYLNAAFKKSIGYTLSDIPTLADWWPLAYPDSEYRQKVADSWQQNLAEANLSGNVFRPLEINVQCRDQSVRTFMCSATNLMGDFSSTHLVVLYDITDQKQSEKNLRIAATVFEAQEGMLVTDRKGIILRVNQAFTRITGYSAEEAIGKNPSLLSSGRHDSAFYANMWESINNTGAWDGEIWNRRKNGDIYPEHLTITAVKDTMGNVSNYVATLTDITMSKAASDEIKSLAFYDPLTQLPNRRLLMDRLKQALASSARSGQRGALLFLDLDHFKNLNDSLGHDIGDLLLQQVAERLVSCVREGDTVARLGGDEFVVLLEDLSQHEIEAATQTESIGDKILVALNKPYILAAREHSSTPSIGVTLFNDHDAGVEALIKQADIAMYEAKASGRNALRFFDPKMQEAISIRIDLETELRKAIAHHQFQLHYQIQVNSVGRPIGAEALIRWQHPERGMVSPFYFITLAEETGLILPIGQWVLETACEQLKLWEQDEVSRHLTLSVNVSAKQFLQSGFIEQVLGTVVRHAINPALLKLELTESVLVGDVDSIIVKMRALSDIGIKFSLDDFGTGYSSLQYLKQLPLYQLKIDQSFVRDIVDDPQDRAIVRTIIAMAHSLDLNVIAEGVETEEQRQRLLNKDCLQFQGYLFGKPMPIKDFDASLRETTSV